MSMIVHNGKISSSGSTPSWYARGWEDYDDHGLSMREGLDALHQNGEHGTARSEYKRGWRDALVVDLCDSTTAPKWMKKEMGL